MGGDPQPAWVHSRTVEHNMGCLHNQEGHDSACGLLVGARDPQPALVRTVSNRGLTRKAKGSVNLPNELTCSLPAWWAQTCAPARSRTRWAAPPSAPGVGNRLGVGSGVHWVWVGGGGVGNRGGVCTRWAAPLCAALGWVVVVAVGRRGDAGGGRAASLTHSHIRLPTRHWPNPTHHSLVNQAKQDPP